MNRGVLLITLSVSFSSSVFSLVGHPASQVIPGTFQTGDYTFTNGQLRAQWLCDEVGADCNDVSAGWTTTASTLQEVTD